MNDESLERSKKSVQAALALFVDEELISRAQADDTASRISWTTDLEEAAASDLSPKPLLNA